MALPTILIDSASGSDSAASGAGPATALTGTAASTSADGLTVTLDGSPDLTGVATDGSHAIYLADATAGARNFGKITAKDNTAKTVTVANAFGLSLTGKSWAIGGKRASLGDANSKKLLRNNAAAGDAKPGWKIQFAQAHTETIAGPLEIQLAGNGTDGRITIEGESETTVPVLTFSNNGNAFQFKVPNSGITVQNLECRNSNATKTSTLMVAVDDGTTNTDLIFRNIRSDHATDYFAKFFSTSNNRRIQIEDCFLNGRDSASAAGVLFYNTSSVEVRNNVFVGLYQQRHYFSHNGITVADNIFYSCTGSDGALVITGNDGGADVHVRNNVFYGNTGAGAYFNLGATNNVWSENNIFEGNGGWGQQWVSTNADSEYRNHVCRNNHYYNNTSGTKTGGPTETGAVTSTPAFPNPSGYDFTTGANGKAAGWPTKNVGRISSTRSYVDTGMQRQEPAGGGGIIFPTGNALVY